MGVAGHPILAKGVAKAIFGGGSTTPIWPKGVAQALSQIYIFFFRQKKPLKIKNHNFFFSIFTPVILYIS
jgi:hypothetical protein